MSGIGAEDRLREASRWFAARRRGVMTVDERARYEIWIGDADNMAAMARLDHTWKTLGTAEHRMNGAGRITASVPRSRLARPA
jgi:ferric-dicitrate binding protein FerR (iron transport regulator)